MSGAVRVMGNASRLVANRAINFAVLSLLLFCFSSRLHAETVSARILVYGIHQGDNIVYHYKVINNSSETLHQFVLGSTYDPIDDTEYPQLERLPSGWSYGQEGETGTEILLSPASTTQPPHWSSDMYGQQESGWHYLRWATEQDGHAYAVPPGNHLPVSASACPCMIQMRLLAIIGMRLR